MRREWNAANAYHVCGEKNTHGIQRSKRNACSFFLFRKIYDSMISLRMVY